MTAPGCTADVFAEVRDIVRRSAKIPPRVTIEPGSRLVEDLAIDSIDLVNLIIEIQERFEIDIDVEAVPRFCRVADLTAYLTERSESEWP